jgi:hypothetical protein
MVISNGIMFPSSPMTFHKYPPGPERIMATAREPLACIQRMQADQERGGSLTSKPIAVTLAISEKRRENLRKRGKGMMDRIDCYAMYRHAVMTCPI